MIKYLLILLLVGCSCPPVDMRPTSTWHRTSREPLPPSHIIDTWLAHELSVPEAWVTPKADIVRNWAVFWLG